MKIHTGPVTFLLMLAIASPVTARVLTTADWQASAYRVTHVDKHGNFDQDQNYAFMIYDYQTARNAMSTGWERARRLNSIAIASGKSPLFCPPAKDPELNSGEINAYFNTLPLDYRKKTPMVEAMLGFVIHKFPCTGIKAP